VLGIDGQDAVGPPERRHHAVAHGDQLERLARRRGGQMPVAGHHAAADHAMSQNRHQH
jgi:hypothetical protein